MSDITLTELDIIKFFGGANRRCSKSKTEAQAKFYTSQHSERNDKWVEKHNRQVSILEQRFVSIGVDYSAICADGRVELLNGVLIVR